jgi:hypothetical protein
VRDTALLARNCPHRRRGLIVGAAQSNVLHFGADKAFYVGARSDRQD